MSHYASGTRFEHKIRDDLRSGGYTILRAAGSKGDSKIDLVAIRYDGALLFVQAKRSDGKLGPAEWNRLYEVAGWAGAVPVIAVNGERGRGVVYERITAPRVPRSHTWPKEPFDPHALGVVIRTMRVLDPALRPDDGDATMVADK